MLTLTAGLAALSSDLFLYYTRDPLLENLPVVIFYGPATTGNTTQNSSRIQSHVLSLAGFFSFPRLTVSPTSPLYAAVSHLPLECQGDEISRGLAVSLLSYFAALSKETKASLRSLAGSRRPNGVAPMMFDEMHAGELAAKMEQVEGSGSILDYLNTAVVQQSISWLDIDVRLPFGSIKRAMTIEDKEETEAFDENGLPLFDYGRYNSIVRQLGSPAFFPTSKLKRTFSKPTPHHKIRILSKDAKINLRRELCEIVDTENTYLTKLSELVNQIATSFRQQNEIEDVEALFPESLDKIFKLSEGFYDEIQSVLDATEDEAIRDIESLSTSEPRIGKNEDLNDERDATGATTFSRTMLSWFPKFLQPYQDYLRASTHFSQFLSDNAKDASSDFSLQLNSIGEQYLRSALIEPVQRLPRYSLLIDNMVNLLPLSHPALSNLSKARDIINQICTLETTTSSEGSNLSKTMSTIVQDWPTSLLLAGRLIAAIDVVELDPPYDPGKRGNPGVILLLQDRLVLLDKLTAGALSARGVLAEVDRPAMQAHIDRYLETGSKEKTLGLSEIFELSKIRITQSKDGRVVHLTDLATAHPKIRSTTHFKVFCLQGAYENKAPRLGEEIAKARIEGRYTEAVRDSGRWALRSLAHPQQVSLLLALSENCQLPNGNNKPRGGISLCIGDGTTDHVGSEATIKANITISEATMCGLSIEVPYATSYKVECSIEDVVPTLVKRLGEMLRREYEQDIDGQTSYYRMVLHSLPLHEHHGEAKHHSFRPISPIKLLSKVFSGDVGISRSPIKSGRDVPTIPASRALPSPSKETTSPEINADAQDARGKVTLLGPDNGLYKSPLSILEDTFLAYVVALRSRRGNVIGKILRNRAAADELAINELYNTLLEDPSRLHMAAQAPVDVLFASFEKFLRVAWRERMGPLVSPMAIQKLQSSLEAQRPTFFAQEFKSFLDEMPPQSRRCFATMMKLLLELLEGSGNDGDRGVLIVSFAEALVLVGNPHDYIHLLDRLVDDYDHLFEDAVDKPASSGSATGSATGSRSVNAGSVGSNTSSLRRKFGLGGGLNRENSKSESESKVASIWRTMSKNTKSPGDTCLETNSQPESTPKASLIRSRSTDTASKMLAFRRPDSRDRPPTAGSGVSDGHESRPGSAHNTFSGLRNIGEGMTIDASILKKKKKKRRSSLSDLLDVKDGSPLPLFTPLQPREIPPRASSTKTKALPRTPSPRKTSRGNRTRHSPPHAGLPSRPTYQRGRENSPYAAATKENLPPPLASPPKINPEESTKDITLTSSSPKKRTTSRSHVPAPKSSGLSERTWPPNSNNTPPKKTTPDGSPRKLRIQSPQKLRERLSQEQKSIVGEQIDLQEEIDKIAQEFSTFKLRPHVTNSLSNAKTSQQNRFDDISGRLETLSATLTSFTTRHTATTNLLRTDLDSSLHNAEKKARKLDELYREANAENEALYDRFNAELEKVLGRVKKGEGVDEMKERLGKAVKEAAQLRAEKAKLVREVTGLKSLVKD